MTYTSVTLSGYQPQEPIYCGSRTLVYRATHTLNGRPVILKLLYQFSENLHSINGLSKYRTRIYLMQHHWELV